MQIDKPIITEEFFPLYYKKYITIHTGGGDGKFDSKLYDYWNEVMFLIRPLLSDYKIVQLGDEGDRVIQGIDANILGKTTVKQSAYVLKRAVMHFGNDSFPIHMAGALNIPTVSIYGPTTIANHGPYWHNKDSVFLESDRAGAKPNFSRQEAPKTINMIKPETIANAILRLLEIDTIPAETIFMGNLYGKHSIEYIPDVLVHPNSLKDKSPNIRLDYHFNEDLTFKTLSNTKCSVITDKELNLDILKQLRKNIEIFAFEIKEDTDYEYLLKLKHASLPLRLFSKEKDKRKLSDLRARFFEVGTIDFLDENPDPIENFEDNLKFKSAKVIIGRGKIYSSLAHYKAEDETDNVINTGDFWKDKNFFWIYKNG